MTHSLPISNAVLITCQHTRKMVVTSPTTNYPPPAIVCLDCGQTLMTVEEARAFVDAVAEAEGK